MGTIMKPDIIVDWPGVLPSYRCVTKRAVDWVLENVPAGGRYLRLPTSDLLFQVRLSDEGIFDRARAEGLVLDTNPVSSAKVREKIIGERFREVREHLEYKAWEVALHLGVKEALVLRVECGEARFSGGELTALAKMYGVEVDDLLDGAFKEKLAEKRAPQNVVDFAVYREGAR